jgi:type 1 glutamine amidotransferase
VTEEPGGLSSAVLQNYDVLLLNYNGPRWPHNTEIAIEGFVKEGGGFVAVHQAIYGEFFGHVFSDREWRAGAPDAAWNSFSKMIGAYWAPEDIGHARRTVFSVEWRNTNHPVSSGLPSSFVANDELYHKIGLQPSVEVLADAKSPLELGGTGERESLVWTNLFGRGRVFFTTLGHDALAWHEPGMVNLLARGTEWAATGQVSIAPVVRGHSSGNGSRIRLLVVTGGHSYPTSFYAMLDSLPSVEWTHATSHAEAFRQPIEERFDALLLHDMMNETTEQTRDRLRAFVEAGHGVLSLHHSIVDYTDWPWWYEEVTGGKYFVEPAAGYGASHFKEDEEFLVTKVKGKENHAVLKGIDPLWVYDELYRNMFHSGEIEILMETAHPDNDPPVVYVGPHKKARVVYIQLGHSDDTMKNPGFRRLISNTVNWIARRTD